MTEGLVYVSTAVWAICLLVWWIAGERRLASPIFLYLVFHGLTFVLRPIILLNTGDYFFLNNIIGVGLTPQNHREALLIANAALIAMLTGALIGEEIARRKGAPATSHVLPERVIRPVGIAIIIFGCVSYLLFAPNPLSGPGGTREVREVVVSDRGVTAVSTTTAYITAAYALIGGVFLAWTAFLGFRRRWVVPLGIYFLALAYVGAARTHYVLGFMAMLLIVMATQHRRWPRPAHVGLGLLVVVAFLSGKFWLQAWHLEGRASAQEQMVAGLETTFQGEGALFSNYDMYASTTYLVPTYADHTGLTLYARPLYQWIPRAIWPNKPIFGYSAAYLQGEVQTVNFRGRVVTIVGESYIAFGLAGVIVLSLLYGIVFNYVSARAYRHPVASVERVFGIAFIVVLFQVYRDGIISMQLYLMLYFGPCAAMWLATRAFVGSTVYRNAEQEPVPCVAPPRRPPPQIEAPA
jgi:oligosaccharide repeat unit polymerase